MGLILDTSVLVAAERGRFDVAELLAANPGQDIAIAAITASELLVGAIKSRDDTHRVRRTAAVEARLARIPLLEFGIIDARQHALLQVTLERGGVPINAHDLLIAATALARGFSLATLDLKHFSRVPGLQLVDVQPFVRV